MGSHTLKKTSQKMCPLWGHMVSKRKPLMGADYESKINPLTQECKTKLKLGKQ